MHVVVVGGVGLIGVQFVKHLGDHGVEVAAGSLRTGVNAYSGRGLVATRNSDVITGPVRPD